MPGSASRRCSALALLAAGCGSGERRRLRRQAPRLREGAGRLAAAAGRPAPAGRTSCSPAAQDAYEKRIAALRGYPVVVNVWASWCGPCRFEFPTLQKLSAKYGKRVAFLGVNSQDSDDAAEDLPRRGARSPTPATPTPTRTSKTSLGAGFGLPDTAFYDRDGELVYLKQGQYSDEERTAGRHRALRARRRMRKRIIGAWTPSSVIAADRRRPAARRAAAADRRACSPCSAPSA